MRKNRRQDPRVTTVLSRSWLYSPAQRYANRVLIERGRPHGVAGEHPSPAQPDLDWSGAADAQGRSSIPVAAQVDQHVCDGIAIRAQDPIKEQSALGKCLLR